MNRYNFTNLDVDVKGKTIFDIIYLGIGNYTAEEIQKSDKYILDNVYPNNPMGNTTRPDIFTDDIKQKILANRKGREKKFIVTYGPTVYFNRTSGKSEMVFSGYWK